MDVMITRSSNDIMEDKPLDPLDTSIHNIRVSWKGYHSMVEELVVAREDVENNRENMVMS